ICGEGSLHGPNARWSFAEDHSVPPRVSEAARTRSAGRDGYDTAEWIRKQTWCNGKVATWGHSYLASDQWLTAALGTPLDAMCPSAGAADFYQNQYVGGAYMLGMARAGYSVGFYGPPPEVGKSPE